MGGFKFLGSGAGSVARNLGEPVKQTVGAVTGGAKGIGAVFMGGVELAAGTAGAVLHSMGGALKYLGLPIGIVAVGVGIHEMNKRQKDKDPIAALPPQAQDALNAQAMMVDPNVAAAMAQQGPAGGTPVVNAGSLQYGGRMAMEQQVAVQ